MKELESIRQGEAKQIPWSKVFILFAMFGGKQLVSVRVVAKGTAITLCQRQLGSTQPAYSRMPQHLQLVLFQSCESKYLDSIKRDG